MFLKFSTTNFLKTKTTTVPSSYNIIASMSSTPRNMVGNYSGVSLVAQYLETFKYRTLGHYSISNSVIEAVHAKAVQLDESLLDIGSLEDVSEENPTLDSIMNAFLQLGFVKHATVQYVNNAQYDLKYFIWQYGAMIVQLKVTSSTYNANGFDISTVGEVLSEDFYKGMIAVGFDSNCVICQNSRGIYAGSLGFHKIPWNVFTQLCVNGAVFDVYMDRASNKMVWDT